MSLKVDTEFSQRIARYEKNRKKGLVFQANGTVGGHLAKPQRSAHRSGVFRHILRLAVMLMAIKIGVYHVAGAAAYNQFVGKAAMTAGNAGHAATMVLKPDAVTLAANAGLLTIERWIAGQMRAMR